jgi:D-serine deaminase-like pyridoxal phosphate-dependent protein
MREAITIKAGEVFGAARRVACIRADEVLTVGRDAVPRQAVAVCVAFGAIALTRLAPRVNALADRLARALPLACAEVGLDIAEHPVGRARDGRVVLKVGDKVRVVASEVCAVFQPRPELGIRPQLVANGDVLVLVEA